MKEVKKIFFMDKEEAIRIAGNNSFLSATIMTDYPVFQLEDGTMMYPHYGCPAEGQVWYKSINQ